MFLLVPAHPGFPGQIPQSRKTVVCVCVLLLQRFTAPWTLSGTTQVSWYQKGKTNLDLLDQETVSGSGISWPYANLHLTPDRLPCQHPTSQFFTCQMPFLLPKQRHQSTEGTVTD